jgi:hypothetical protein
MVFSFNIILIETIDKTKCWRDMYGAVLTNPTTSDGDLGVLFMHNEGQFFVILLNWHKLKKLNFMV